MKKFVCLILSILVVSALMGCGASKEESTSIANPWTETDEQGLLEATGYEMTAPADATNVTYSYMKEENLAQMTYELNGHSWCYRIEPTSELTDISGMNYEWTLEEDDTVNGLAAKCLVYSDATATTEYLDDVFGVQVVNWYDPDAGLTYSLSVSGKDINGIDLTVYAAEFCYK